MKPYYHCPRCKNLFAEHYHKIHHLQICNRLNIPCDYFCSRCCGKQKTEVEFLEHIARGKITPCRPIEYPPEYDHFENKTTVLNEQVQSFQGDVTITQLSGYNNTSNSEWHCVLQDVLRTYIIPDMNFKDVHSITSIFRRFTSNNHMTYFSNQMIKRNTFPSHTSYKRGNVFHHTHDEPACMNYYNGFYFDHYMINGVGFRKHNLPWKVIIADNDEIIVTEWHDIIRFGLPDKLFDI